MPGSPLRRPVASRTPSRRARALVAAFLCASAAALALLMPARAGESAADALARDLDAKDARTRELAAWMAGYLGPRAKPLEPRLAALERDREERVRAAAAWATAALSGAAPASSGAGATGGPGRLPAGFQRRPADGVYLWDTGKGLTIEMVYVPPGEFVMGSDTQSDEKPQHKHAMPQGYFIGRTETTWTQYMTFCRASGRKAPDKPAWAGDDHPVVNVDWNDADAFCKWIGGSLPSEAQWEKAARGTDGRTYPWGNDWDGSKCNHGTGSSPYTDSSDGYEYTAPAGKFPKGASPFGALDMAGNVWEWCGDWYDSGSYARYARGDTSPPNSGQYRVYRGGSWCNTAEYVRAAYRDYIDPAYRLDDLGFRPARVTP